MQLGQKRSYLSLFCKKGHYRTTKTVYAHNLACKVCYKIYYKNKPKDLIGRDNRKALYKLSDVKYNKFLTQQNNSCAICKKQNCRLVVDHNHNTKKVRGLLCYRCNSKLVPILENTPNLIEETRKYLQNEWNLFALGGYKPK